MLLVDDQPSVLNALRECLGLEPDLSIVGDAGDGNEALDLARDLHPDIVLTDLKMPGLDGFATTMALRKLLPNTQVIILSIYDDSATRAQAEAAGAFAFVAKHETAEVLIAAIRRAAARLP
jgi:DNA-binding NarL/FixJ family response regulator